VRYRKFLDTDKKSSHRVDWHRPTKTKNFAPANLSAGLHKSTVKKQSEE
jgi:hypothetical protein